eukprot:TRINITY_DN40885_c0_g1_i1.p1 TRINITY_DN40885_c0_g1~~TRINITY_DN40885_c0_g1_i1.p1  ORF type:complete len:380 (+),score=73.30 TRINITY_DN40885_c0_g1_i1:125-1264(+)
MAPLEDLRSRDLEWISDFVMQQMVIMMRPLMDHLQETDTTVDYTQHSLQRLNMDISEVRLDLERTNKHLEILRQGLGVQNEKRCTMQHTVDSTARATKRIEEQIEALTETMRGSEGTLSGLAAEARCQGSRHEDLTRQVVENSRAIDYLQAKVEKACSESHVLRDSVCNGEARLEVWQRELRELRRQLLGVVTTPKQLEEKAPAPTSSQGCRALGVAESSWPQKKSFAAAGDVGGAGVSKDGNGFAASAATGSTADRDVSASGGSRQSKRLNRVSSGTSAKPSLLTQDHLDFSAPQPRSSSRGIWGGVADGAGVQDGAEEGPLTGGHCDDSAPASSRLPLLATRQGGVASRPQDNVYSEGPRWRFTATMTQPPSRGGPV